MSRCLPLFAILPLVLAGCGGATKISNNNPDTKQENSAQIAREMYDAVNSIRQSNKLSRLEWNKNLEMAATKHTEWMNKNKKLSHEGEGGSRLSDRLDKVGYKYAYAAENIACGQTSVSQLMNAWMNSHEGHKENILNNSMNEVGAAKVGNYWTMVFGKRLLK